MAYVNNFSGPVAECTASLRRAGKTKAEALRLINAQIGTAITMLRKAANDLKRGSRSTNTRTLFQKIFRVRPEFVPTWLKTTATIKDRGDVVATRCKRVADLLASGAIKYFCTINSTNCPDCPNDPSDFACSSWGDESVAPRNSRVVCLGNPFWDDMRAGKTISVLATLMHEPFHIFYGRYVTEHTSDRGKFAGIDCIVKFVFEINGRIAPALESAGCEDKAVRAELKGSEMPDFEYEDFEFDGEEEFEDFEFRPRNAMPMGRRPAMRRPQMRPRMRPQMQRRRPIARPGLQRRRPGAAPRPSGLRRKPVSPRSGLRPRPPLPRPGLRPMGNRPALAGITGVRPSPPMGTSLPLAGGRVYPGPVIPYPQPYPVPASNGRAHTADDGATLDPNVLVDMGDDNAASALPDTSADASPDTGADFTPDTSDTQEPGADTGSDAGADATTDASGDFTPDDGANASADSEADMAGGAMAFGQKNRGGPTAGYDRAYQRGFRAGYAARRKKCHCGKHKGSQHDSPGK